MLSAVYKYASLAFVGGGFGRGVHSVLEAAVYGVPLLIGPENHRSCEAQNLFRCGGAVEAVDAYDFGEKVKMLYDDKAYSAGVGEAAGNYIQANVGATARIFEEIGL